jgi:hypothetical protein
MMKRGMSKKKILSAILLVMVIIPLSFLLGQKREEYELKAVMLGIFPTYIEWPDGSRVYDKSQPFVLGLIGDNPFIIKKRGRNTDEDWLNKLYSNKKVKGKDLEIRFISDVKDIPGCDILFVSRSERKKIDEIAEAARTNKVLTVADTTGFAKKGIYINFYIEKGGTKFEVNLSALRDAGFDPNFRMLKLARIINPPKGR